METLYSMPFNKDYYVNSRISNYEDYREKKFSDLADDLCPYLEHKCVLDYGAATGGLIYELTARNIYCEGTDISYWAVEFGKKHYDLANLLHHYDPTLLTGNFDIVLFLDVLEHIPSEELECILNSIYAQQLIVRIPVARNEGEDFVLEVSKNDKTHIQIHSKEYWLALFKKYGYTMFTPLNENNIYNSDGVLAGILKSNMELI